MTRRDEKSLSREVPVREAELDRLDPFRDLRDRHLVISGLRVAWRPKADPGDLGLETGDLWRLYEFMALAKAVEDRVGELFRQGLVPGTAFAGRGNEALSVGAAYALAEKDVLVPMHRNVASHLVRGQDLKQLMAQYLARANGITRGRDLHYGNRELRIFQLISHIGTMVPIAAGAAWASKVRNDGTAVLAMSGDGATSTGDFHEGLNLAAVHRLPLVVVVENNLWVYKTPTRLQYTCKTLALRAVGYGIPGYLIDGTDVVACYEVCREALERARSGEGPVLIESVNERLCGHSVYDSYKDYVPEEEVAAWSERDPILLFEAKLRAWGRADEAQFRRVGDRIRRAIDEAVQHAKDSPFPEGPEVCEGVYAP
ncbi:MAG: thiamine pyrophosphate-dependent dehydrogenase E1 component subunit alpha [Candidatus Tectomicrobia bacterium]|nr:thiamine pyrophosphate-dependent dehydrogenase E1 component subunit alpha [Candidatus Tectomicrobia bacterium]